MKNNNYTKDDFIRNISLRRGYSVSFCKKIINDLIIVLTNNIKNNQLNLKNIGTFKLIKKKERIGRNPKTMENFVINSRKSISFIASKKLLNILNQNL